MGIAFFIIIAALAYFLKGEQRGSKGVHRISGARSRIDGAAAVKANQAMYNI